MSDFDDALKAMDAAQMSIFGDSIVYVPGDGGDERTINAIVDYEPTATVPATPQGHSYKLTIAVRNDTTLGIATTEVDTGRDQVTVATRHGKTPENRRIVGIVEQDASMVTYGVM